ncbi:hypothetical protein [uncultured Clostridium sp.]|uniref:TcaA 3rd/4th domain-containing protein n=1 Tax=uncultured Clostridium sp. TaxID=59620 RepID=UPI00261F54BF|nr:hypothetical protein [uncultured Clostridium sp.]
MKKDVKKGNFKRKTIEKTKKLNLKKINGLAFWQKNKKIIIPTALVLCLILGYLIGMPKDNKNEVINKLKVGLENSNIKTLNSIIKVNGKEARGNELEPLTKYFSGRSDKVLEFVNLVENNGATKIMEIRSEKNIFGKRYYIDLKTFDLLVNANLKDVQITLNNKKIEAGKTIENIIPGQYNLEASVNSKYGIIKETGEIIVLNNTNINLDLKGEKVTVNSEFEDAEVLVNGVSSKKKVKDFKDIGPMPMDGSISLSLEKEFPWGKIQGEKVIVKDSSIINLKINMANDKLWTEVDSSLNNFYESVFNALNNENGEEIKESTEEAKNKIYSILEKKYLFLKNTYKLESLTIDKEKSNFSYKDGKYIGTVVCDVDYTISKDIFGIIGVSNDKENKKFFTNVVYQNGKWIVNNVENFSL